MPLALLVEDSAAICDILARKLEGWETRATERLDEAQRLCESLRPRLVVLDLILGEGDEKTSLEAIAPFHAKGAAVLVCSGLRDTEVPRRAMAAGADGYFDKVDLLNTGAFLAACEAALRHYDSHQQAD